MREIGSEFWKKEQHHISVNEQIYLSGRTALDMIVKDSIQEYGIVSALLPSYCCHTMIEPFLQNGVSVRFYDIYVGDGGVLTADIPEPLEKEALYIMKYFGSADLRCEGKGSSMTGWATTIEDLTHSCFCKGYTSVADYWFTSYRKWFAIDGIAVAGKRGEPLSLAQHGTQMAYCKLRNRAFYLKQRYLSGKATDHSEKQEYLDTFAQAENLLSEDYQGYGANPESIYELFHFMDEMEDMRQKRRNNATFLIQKLKMVDGIKIITDFSGKRDCPLFVPVVVENGKRDTLRRYLISKDIYCPVHWSISEMHMGISERAEEIYDKEVSLVCDQRYGIQDMEKISDEILSYLK